MQNKILLIIMIVLSIVLIVVPKSSPKETTFFSNVININVKDKNTGQIEKMDLEKYIIGVVAAEMPASFNEEALKAQAVASRTYAIYKINASKKDYDVITDVSNQSYITIDDMKNKWKNNFEKYYQKIEKAVNDTKNKVIFYNDNVIGAFYFSMSNGYTEEVSLVFSEERDYLQSVESNYERNSKNFEITKEFLKKDFCSALEIECDELIFSDILRSMTNRVEKITVNNKEFKGTTFRAKLNLRSTDFDIKETGDKVLITTRGYGHGVGMSQYGANGMAEEGYSYEEILNYFYKNIKIDTI